MSSGSGDAYQLELAIAAQEALRGVVPDEVVDAAVATLRARLADPRPDVERRRQVSVLFADVSGFTAMSARLDPELVADVMNALWARLDAVIESFGGRIDKHIGDAVMAVWGTTSTEEDDPERAVRAGLAMQDELGRRDEDDGLAMRVGINTGPVHLGAVGSGNEFTAIGDTVNVASRVEGVAPRGGVLVTHDTYRHIRGVFDVEAVDPVMVKGKEEPLTLYLVRAVRDRRSRLPTRGVEGVETRMVGRSRELATLRAEFERVVVQPEIRRATVIGDAGVGKSRLLYELQRWLEVQPTEATVLKGRAIATRHPAPLGLLRDLVADHFGVLDSEPTSAVATKLRQGFTPTLTADEADLVGHWLGFELSTSPAVQGLLGSGQLATTARVHFLHALESLAAAAPVVLLLEDLHWADEESLRTVDELVARGRPAHLLIVGVGRPTLLERSGFEGMLERLSGPLVLEPLGSAATRELVGEILQHAGPVPDELTELILERADGNSFYVEELLKMLIEDGVIEVGADRWHVHVDQLRTERVPTTLTGVLQTRLDSLTHAERDALQRAAVIGRVFWDGAVQWLGREESPSTSGSLEQARDRELVFRHEQSSFDDAVEYVFKHALLRDVTYETVLLRDRERLHGLVARWMSEHAGDRASEHATQIALHLRLAGEVMGAAELLRTSAAAALDAGNSLAARRQLEEAVGLWEATGQGPPADALIALAESCVRLGDIAAAQRYDDEALRQELTPEQRTSALYIGSWIASEQGDHNRERTMLHDALPDAERIGGLLHFRVVIGLCWWEHQAGHSAAAHDYVDRARELASQLHHPVVSREILGTLGAIAAGEGDIPGSLGHSAAALATSVETGDLEGQALAHSNIGVGRHLLGDAGGGVADYHAALEHYRQAKDLNVRLGRPLQDGMTAANMAQIQVRLGDDDAARRLLREALIKVRRSGGTGTLLFCVLAEGDRRLAIGDVQRGLELLGLIRAHPSRTKDQEDEIERILGRVALPADEVELAMVDGARQDLDRIVEQLLGELDQPAGWPRR